MESRSSAWFWTVTVVFGVFVSLGSQFPFMSLLAGLPGIGLLRVPSRAMFVSGFAFAVLAAIGLDRLLRGLAVVEVRRVKGVLVGLVGVFFGLALATGWLGGGIPKGLAWGALAFLSIGGWIWTREWVSNRFSPGMWLAGLLLVACVDLGGVDLQAIDSRRFESVISEGEAAAAYISAQPGKFRVYSPSYSIPQQTVAIYRLELVDGVDPLQVESLTGFMEEASGVPRVGYSVTVPSFATGSPEVDNQAYRPDPKKLGLLNVGYVAAEYDLPVEGLVLRARFGDTRVYENAYSRPRAWVQMEGEGTTSAIEPAESLVWTPNEISVTAAGPGMLVLSEIAYPGWQARVDGVGQEIQVVEGLLRGVRLDPGTNKVVFTYRPYSLYLGLGLLLAAIFFLVYRRFLRINLRRSGPQEVET